MLNAARLIRGYAVAMIEDKRKRVRSDAVYLPDPKGGLDNWKLVMMRRHYMSSSSLVLQVKPCDGAVRHGAGAQPPLRPLRGAGAAPAQPGDGGAGKGRGNAPLGAGTSEGAPKGRKLWCAHSEAI